jgi:hypothetical protein
MFGIEACVVARRLQRTSLGPSPQGERVMSSPGEGGGAGVAGGVAVRGSLFGAVLVLCGDGTTLPSDVAGESSWSRPSGAGGVTGVSVMVGG